MILGGEYRFRFDLAEKLGMTVGELGERMSSAEFTEWGALQQVRMIEEAKARKRAARGGKRRR